MSQLLRFPFPRPIPGVSPAEESQIITLESALAGTLPLGGSQNYTSVAAWKTSGNRNTETPYTCVAIEFSADGVGTIGNGTTELIGLFGQIDLVANPTTLAGRKRTLLAILGINIGNQMPQIPIVVQVGPANDVVGYTQLVSNVAAYDRLSIGGVLGTVDIPEAREITVVARPLRRKDYLG
jgi:hypothetical protein